MTTIASTLLSFLGNSSTLATRRDDADQPDFNPALSAAFPVTAAKGVDIKLTDEQWGRLTKATDAAHAQGSTRALVLLDGQAFTLDVTTRQVLGTADLSTGKALTGIDAVIQAPASTTPARKASIETSADLLAKLNNKADAARAAR